MRLTQYRSLAVERTGPRVPRPAGPPDSGSPRTWFDVVNLLAQLLTGAPARTLTLGALFSGSNVLFLWQPSAFAFLAAVLGRPFVYLCWGAPSDDRSRLVYWIK